MLLETLDVGPERFASGTGWLIEPQGACKGDVCVPLDRSHGFDLAATAERLGMALVQEPGTALWALGPESLGERALVSAEAPELALPDLSGREFLLSSLRGQKVLLVAWAPW